MKTFWVSWTFYANYSNGFKRVDARDAAEAVASVAGFFSDDFRNKATVYVTTERPEVFQGDLLVRAIKGGA